MWTARAFGKCLVNFLCIIPRRSPAIIITLGNGPGVIAAFLCAISMIIPTEASDQVDNQDREVYSRSHAPLGAVSTNFNETVTKI